MDASANRNMSSTNNRCEMGTLFFPTMIGDHSLLDIDKLISWDKRSIHRTKTYRERRSPCQMPLEGVITCGGSLFYKT